MKEIFKIAEEENLTMQEVRTILQVNFIINRFAERYETFKDTSLLDLWKAIPQNKIVSCINYIREMKLAT
ncbi:hypothetical protein J4771_06020 [Candidatus Kaistella beijingensis]|uniref:hypothetical protein n=1 Tax=Candidatus Kaistella beijingensis TaxID=2820270 RepID=UPI001CC45D4A|nr:hypothetical protein [Candidatus Kaistella beijingensis]UBB90895.1 hypothetical protein J4771_06020 [Candidatus Kaistella beijingensis]